MPKKDTTVDDAADEKTVEAARREWETWNR